MSFRSCKDLLHAGGKSSQRHHDHQSETASKVPYQKADQLKNDVGIYCSKYCKFLVPSSSSFQ